MITEEYHTGMENGSSIFFLNYFYLTPRWVFWFKTHSLIHKVFQPLKFGRRSQKAAIILSWPILVWLTNCAPILFLFLDHKLSRLCKYQFPSSSLCTCTIFFKGYHMKLNVKLLLCALKKGSRKYMLAMGKKGDFAN